jgi:predicted nucleic acid-binding protein
LLVYAHNEHAPHHAKAKDWWNACLRGPQAVGLAWVVMLGFVRITTHPKGKIKPKADPEEETVASIRHHCPKK